MESLESRFMVIFIIFLYISVLFFIFNQNLLLFYIYYYKIGCEHAHYYKSSSKNQYFHDDPNPQTLTAPAMKYGHGYTENSIKYYAWLGEGKKSKSCLMRRKESQITIWFVHGCY